MKDELKYLEELYDLMFEGGLGDTGELMSSVRQRITSIKIERDKIRGLKK